MSKNKILIVSYELGTKNGVGGRRWLNYGLELLRQGQEVFFLTYSESIPSDLKEYSNNVFRIKSNYPSVLGTVPKTIFEKISYRLWLRFVRKKTKGTPYDKAKRSKNRFLHTAQKIIEQNKITHLVVSGAPFSLLYFGVKLKGQNEHLKLISDYRDAWTSGIGYGITDLSKEDFDYELLCEKEVLNASDVVTVASKDVEVSLKKVVPTVEPYVLMNFVNNEQFEGFDKFGTSSKNKNKVIITHIGSANQGTDKYWKKHLLLSKEYSDQHELNIINQFIGGKNKAVKDFVQQEKLENVLFYPNQQGRTLCSSLANSDLFMMFKNDTLRHSFPTKYFDYIYFRKPIFCYSISGSVTDEIEQNKLGAILNDQSSGQEFSDQIEALYLADEFNKNYDYEKFSLSRLTQELIRDVLSDSSK